MFDRLFEVCMGRLVLRQIYIGMYSYLGKLMIEGGGGGGGN